MAFKRILLRRDTSSNWTSGNPTLSAGELGFETNTGKFKIGNGSTAWTSLGYSIVSNLSSAVLNDLGDVTITSAQNGDFLRWNGTAFVNDAVNLSTDTVGSFVESLVAGTGITLSNNSGEGATPTVAVTTNTFDAFGAASTAAGNAATALTNHEADTTNIHGIADTSILVTTTGTQTLTNKTITSPSGLVKGDVGLGNVDNTADTAKPVSTAQQTALDLKANLASPTFTGTPTLPTGTIATTQNAANNTTAIATTAYVDTAVANLVDSAPATLNTLDELALALGDDPSFATTVATNIGLKAPLASPTFTGTVTVPTPVNNTDAVTKAYVDGGIATAGDGEFALLAGATFTGAINTPNSTGSMIPFYYASAASFPAANNSHGAIAHSHATGLMYYAHGGSWIEMGNSQATVMSVAGTTYALQLTDASKYLSFTNAAAITLSVPLNAGVTFATNAWVDITSTTSPLIISPAAGVTVNKSAGQWLIVLPNQKARLTQTSTDVWHFTVDSFPSSFIEPILVGGTGAAGTINIDFASNSSILRTGNATGNFVLNIRGTPTTTMNDILAVGEVATVSIMATMGATPYYATAYQVDGVAITPKWQGGTAITAGQASSINMYTVTLIKTGSATYTAFASMTKFA